MEFPDQVPRPLDPEVIADAPERPGFYGLYRLEPDGERRYVYIGFGNIRRCLRDHVDGVPPEVLAEKPTFWITAYTSAVERMYVELVESLKPIYHDPGDVFIPPGDPGWRCLDCPAAYVGVVSEPFRFTTPLGSMEATVGASGEIARLAFADDPGVDGGSAAGSPVARQVGEYFARERRVFELVLDPHGTDFELAVWKALLEVPWGQTIGYGELARRIGRPDAARAVGRAVGANPIAIVVPCHRALGADGALTGYAGGIERKRALLELEGSLPLGLDV